MRRFLLAALFIPLAASAAAVAAQAPAQKLSKFSPPGGDFSVMMPGTPKESTETKESPIGKYTSHLFVSSDDAGLYLVGWVDYGPRRQGQQGGRARR